MPRLVIILCIIALPNIYIFLNIKTKDVNYVIAMNIEKTVFKKIMLTELDSKAQIPALKQKVKL